MSSDLSHLKSHHLDQPPPQQDPSNTDELRVTLHQLDTTAQTLKAEKAALEKQIQAIRERIFANDNLIRRTMENLGGELFRDQRAERQSAFQSSTVENENVIEGIFNQMQGSPQLTQAVHAVVKDEGSLQDNNIVAAAIMLELTGNTFQFGHDVAVRVAEFEKAHNEALAALTEPAFNFAQPYFDPASLAIDPAITGASTEGARDQSVIALGDSPDASISAFMSPSVKSEPNSIATPYNVTSSLSALTAAALNTTPGNVTASVESISPRPARQASVVTHGLTNLQKSFPGLLESINTTTPAIRSKAPTPPGKRGRGQSSREGSPSPSLAKMAKRYKPAKPDKEPAISHNFINYMKHLEQLHQTGKSISTNIRCSRCQQIKRDVRVLNCLHMYCHRCVLQLRGQAQHGNAITGFQSTCVKPSCNQVVSGKTTVIDSDIVDFLQWYDTQPNMVTSMVCQIHVLNTAAVKYPEDNAIKAKLQQMQNHSLLMTNRNLRDQPVDLMVIAKLIRKPYII